jgi:type IX secretion system PorP/SprF family membrane protein
MIDLEKLTKSHNSMFRKYLLLLIFELSVSIGFSQQFQKLSDYFPKENIDDKSIFFKRQKINPSFSFDTIHFRYDLNLEEQFAGLYGSPEDDELNVNYRIPKMKSMLGLDIEYFHNNYFKELGVGINYSYYLRLNENSSLTTGLNLGLSRLKHKQPNVIQSNLNLMADDLPAISLSNLDLGITYKIYNQHIGLSCLELIKNTQSGSGGYSLTQRTIMINYFSDFKVTTNFKIAPELIVMNESRKMSYAIDCKTIFYNKYSTGLVYNEDVKTIGVMLSARIFKYFEIGYMFDSYKQNESTYGTHDLKLSFLF